MSRGRGSKKNPAGRTPQQERGSPDREIAGGPDDLETKLDYIRQMLVELRQIAQDTGEGTLVYMIEMAAMEAKECSRLRKLSSRMDK